MDRAHWLLAAGLSAIAVAAMALVVAESEPPADEPDAPVKAKSEETRAALAASGGLNGCINEVTPAGEDDEGLDIEAITEKVERLRELRFADEPDVELLPVEELDERIGELVREELRPSDVLIEERILKLLGAIPPDADLFELYTAGLEGQVAGVYLPETKELLVAEGEEVGALERITLAHELEHALADERLGIPFEQKIDPAHADSELAELALVEGDATVLMERYAVKHVALGDLLAAGDPASFAQQDADLGKLPYHLQRELLWPYSDGAGFVCALYRRGGWGAVNRAYDQPPTATDQVIFPERYGEEPVDSSDPGDLPAPWTKQLPRQLGAAPLMWLFEAPGGDADRALPDPRGAVSSWAGGEAVLWTDDGRSALGVALAERAGARTLCAAVAGWYAFAHPDEPRRDPGAGEELVVEAPGQAAVLSCPPGEVRLGIAPELALARRLAG